MSSVSRQELMRVGLPAVYHYSQHVQRLMGIPRPPRICLIGPTQEELAEYEPAFLKDLAYATVDDGWPIHLPVSPDTDFRVLLERQWEVESDWVWINLVLLPRDVEVWRTIPREQDLLPKELLRNASPGLALACLLDTGRVQNHSILVLEDNELTSSASGRLLEHVKQVWASNLGITKREVRDILRKVRLKEHSAAEVDARPISRFWKQGKHTGYRPGFVWSLQTTLDTASNDLLSMVGLISYEGRDALQSVHMRRVHWDQLSAPEDQRERIEELIDVAAGNRPRIEDDCFVPLYEVLNSSHWSAAFPDRKLAGYTNLAKENGYPLRRIVDICQSIEQVDDWASELANEQSLWMIAHGEHAGRVYLRELPEDVRGQRVFRLTVDDPDFLWRVVNSYVIHTNIICRCYGSYKSPRITLPLVRETLVPWPRKEQRRELSERIVKQRELATSIEEAAAIYAEIAENVLAQLEDGHYEAVTPWSLDGIWSDFDVPYRKVEALMQRAPKSALGSQAATVPPAPIAILRRRLENASDARERLSLMTTLVETVIRYDAAILLAALEAVDRGALISTLSKVATGSEWRASLGHWRSIQRAARARLRRCLEGDAPVIRDAPFGDFLAVLANCPVKLEELADRAVAWRNRDAHGASPSHHECEQLVGERMAEVSELLNATEYMNRHRLLYVESVRKTRHHTEAHVRLLVHAFAEYERDTIISPRDGVLDRVNGGEVYVEHHFPNHLLSLYPWMRFDVEPTTSNEAVWFLDKVLKDKLVFSSPQIAQGHLDTDDGHEAVRQLIYKSPGK